MSYKPIKRKSKKLNYVAKMFVLYEGDSIWTSSAFLTIPTTVLF